MGTINMTFAEVEKALLGVGDPDLLQTTGRDLVSAINELFTYASNGKAAIAAAITGAGGEAAADETFASLATKILGMSVKAVIVNCDSIVPTGDDATATYYNVDFGVKVGAMPNGDIIVAMKGGTSTGYETLNFLLGTVPEGVTITAADATASTNVTAKIGMIYACIIHGLAVPCELAVTVEAGSTSYDNTNITIDLVEVVA